MEVLIPIAQTRRSDDVADLVVHLTPGHAGGHGGEAGICSPGATPSPKKRPPRHVTETVTAAAISLWAPLAVVRRLPTVSR